MKRIRKAKFKKLMIGTTLLVVIASGGYIYYTQSAGSKKLSQFEVRSVEEMTEEYNKPNLILSGEVVAKNSQIIKMDASKGIVSEINVKEGDQVNTGDVLFSYETDQRLKSREASYSKEEKERNLQSARTTANLKWESYNKKQAELEKTQTKLNQASDEMIKNDISQEIKTITNDLDQKYIEAISGENEVATAEAELEKSKEVETVEQERLTYDSVKSEGSGEVTFINKELMTSSQEKKQEETFMEIIDQSQLYVKGKVNEFDKDKVKLNKQVELVDRKDPNVRWQGKVVQLANLGEEGANKKQDDSPNLTKYPYKIQLDKKEKMPLLGTHVYAKFLESTDEKASDKMMVPKDYLFDVKGSKASIWKVSNGKAKKESVEFKHEDTEMVELTKNITMADKIVKPAPNVKEGVEIN